MFFKSNKWLGYPWYNNFDKRPCPRTLSQGANLCTEDTFRIYACEKGLGNSILNGDLVMIYLPHHGFYGGKQ